MTPFAASWLQGDTDRILRHPLTRGVHAEVDKHGVWTATRHEYEPGVDRVGTGDTEDDARADLLAKEKT